jgi:hypothetical protein
MTLLTVLKSVRRVSQDKFTCHNFSQPTNHKPYAIPFAGIRQKFGGNRYLCEEYFQLAGI